MFDEPRYTVRDAIRMVEDGEDLLVFGSTTRFNRISGPMVDRAKSIMLCLEQPRRIDELVEEISDPELDRHMMEDIIAELRQAGIVEPVVDPAVISEEELKRHRLMLNYFSDFFEDQVHLKLVRAILDCRLLLIGSELIGSRFLQSILVGGFSNLRVAVASGTVTHDEVAGSPVYAHTEPGIDKASFLSQAATRYNPLAQVEICPNDRDAIRNCLSEVDLTIVALDAFDHPFLDWLNRECVEARTPWMLCTYVKDEGWITTMNPYVTACYRCFEKRFQASRVYVEAHQTELLSSNGIRTMQSGIGPALDLLASYASMECMRLVPFLKHSFEAMLEERRQAGSNAAFDASHQHLRYGFPETWGTLVTLKVHPFEVEKHHLLKIPRCQVCGVSETSQIPTIPWVMPL